MGSTQSQAVCTDCGKLGAKILHEEFNGYGKDAQELTSIQQGEVFEAASNHLELHPEHSVHIVYGHNENIIDPDTGCSKVIYQHGSAEDATP